MVRKRRRDASKASDPPPTEPLFPSIDADVNVDGSLHEGGGQMVRASVGLACALNVSAHVLNVRAGRANPGLRAQHIAGAHAAATLGGGTLYGARVGSKDIRYVPADPGQTDGTPVEAQSKVEAQVGTAGATALVFQAALPMLVKLAPLTLAIRGGGTHVPHAPSAEYCRIVLCAVAKFFGLQVQYAVERRGFFPRGGANVDVRVQGTLKSWRQRHRARVVDVRGIVVCGADSVRAAADKVRKGARDVLRKKFGEVFEGVGEGPYTVDITDFERNTSPGKSLCVTVYALTEDGGALGSSRILDERAAKELGYRSIDDAAEEVGGEVADELVQDVLSQSAVDRYMSDQIGVLMALAPGESSVGVPAVSLHMKSVQEVLQQMGLSMQFVQNDDGTSEMICGGRDGNAMLAEEKDNAAK